MGIDVENKTSTDSEFLGPFFTDYEKQMIENSGGILSKEILFSAKESLSKVLKTGLTSPLQIYEVSKYSEEGGAISLFYKNFVQYQSTVDVVGDEIRSITLPKNSKMLTDLGGEIYGIKS